MTGCQQQNGHTGTEAALTLLRLGVRGVVPLLSWWFLKLWPFFWPEDRAQASAARVSFLLARP